MHRLNGLSLIATIVALLCLSACGGGGHEAAAPEAAPPPPPPAPEPANAPGGSEAFAALRGAEGSSIVGEVTFTPNPDGGVHITAKVTGLDGAGEHGFHIHETGDCSAADFTSAGGHFNPGGSIHGGPDDAERHAGDLGNISIGAEGSGTLHAVTDLISLDEGAANTVVGRGIILHAGTDDLQSQPTGAAGARLACGVVESLGG